MQPAPILDARAERRAMIALVAAFALLVQALIPGLAAARPLAGAGMTICTEMGLQPAPADGDRPAAPAHACDHCLCPGIDAALPPVVAGEPRAVRYATATADIPPRRPAATPGRGLAAPPPPPRGPPAPEA